MSLTHNLPRKIRQAALTGDKISLSVKTYKIVVIAGDGIGKKVIPEGKRVLELAEKRFGFGPIPSHAG